MNIQPLKIDRDNLINYNRSTKELQQFILFSIAVAGHNAENTAKGINKFIEVLPTYLFASNTVTPFTSIRKMDPFELTKRIKESGLGCYTSRALAFHNIAWSNFRLGTISTDKLETVPYIGMKTSRFFVSFSRRDAQCAILDVHILRWLKSKGVDVPKNTPSSKKTYLRIENEFLKLKPNNKTVAEFDFEIWQNMR